MRAEQDDTRRTLGDNKEAPATETSRQAGAEAVREAAGGRWPPAGDERLRTHRALPTGDGVLTDVVRLRVRYSEGDQMGITYHGRYLDWFAIGRTEWLRSLGLNYSQLEQEGLMLPVLEARCRYLGSTKYDDIVQLETTVFEVTRTRLSFRYEVWRLPPSAGPSPGILPEPGASGPPADEDKPVLVALGETRHAFVDARHRPFDVRKRFPDVWHVLQPLAELIPSTIGDDIVPQGPQPPDPLGSSGAL